MATEKIFWRESYALPLSGAWPYRQSLIYNEIKPREFLIFFTYSPGRNIKLFVRASQGECCVEMSWLWVTYFRSYGHLKKGALCPQTLWFLKNFSGLNIRTKFKCLDWHKGPYLPRQQVSDWHPVQTHILIFGDQSSFSSLNFQMSFWQPFEIWQIKFWPHQCFT